MKRRDVFKAVAGAAVVPLAAGATFKELPRNERVIARKEDDGLHAMQWEDMQEGDIVLATDWDDGMVVNQFAFEFIGFVGQNETGLIANAKQIAIDELWGRSAELLETEYDNT